MPSVDSLKWLITADDSQFNHTIDKMERRLNATKALISGLSIAAAIRTVDQATARIDSAAKTSKLTGGAFSVADVQRLGVLGQLSGAGDMAAALPTFVKTLGNLQGSGKGELAEALNKIGGRFGGPQQIRKLQGLSPREAYMQLAGYINTLPAAQAAAIAQGAGTGPLGAEGFKAIAQAGGLEQATPGVLTTSGRVAAGAESIQDDFTRMASNAWTAAGNAAGFARAYGLDRSPVNMAMSALGEFAKWEYSLITGTERTQP